VTYLMSLRFKTSLRLISLFLFVLLSSESCTRHDASNDRQRKTQVRLAVTALGRVTPGRSVLAIAAQTGSRIAKLEVVEGQKVKAGDVLAYLDSYSLRLAERDAAKTAFDQAWEREETETAYAHALVDQSSQAVQMLELAAEHERKELNRFEKLASEKTVEEQRLDTQRFVAKSRELELGKVKSELQSAQAALARVRSTVGLSSAQANLNVAEAQLELTTIRAPIDGEILKILTYPGERIGNDPILKMGDTNKMYVVAEVEENDIAAVRVGQHATVTSEAVNEPLHGIVEEIGRLIYKNDIFNLDPRADRDTRIVEVRIKLDTPQPVAALTYLEVSVRIDVKGSLAAADRSER